MRFSLNLNYYYFQQDGNPPGLGTVTRALYTLGYYNQGFVDVKWDKPGGSGDTEFYMGTDGKYELQLA